MYVTRCLFFVVLLLTTQANAEERSTFSLVLAGKSCKTTYNQNLSREYKVGTGLIFSIDGIGMPDTGITFVKSSYYDGDFYATYGLPHG